MIRPALRASATCRAKFRFPFRGTDRLSSRSALPSNWAPRQNILWSAVLACRRGPINRSSALEERNSGPFLVDSDRPRPGRQPNRSRGTIASRSSIPDVLHSATSYPGPFDERGFRMSRGPSKLRVGLRCRNFFPWPTNDGSGAAIPISKCPASRPSTVTKTTTALGNELPSRTETDGAVFRKVIAAPQGQSASRIAGKSSKRNRLHFGRPPASPSMGRGLTGTSQEYRIERLGQWRGSVGSARGWRLNPQAYISESAGLAFSLSTLQIVSLGLRRRDTAGERLIAVEVLPGARGDG